MMMGPKLVQGLQLIAAPAAPLPHLRNLQLVDLRPHLDRFLAAGHRLADGFQAHALGRQQVQLLHLIGRPGLPVAFEVPGQLYVPWNAERVPDWSDNAFSSSIPAGVILPPASSQPRSTA